MRQKSVDYHLFFYYEFIRFRCHRRATRNRMYANKYNTLPNPWNEITLNQNRWVLTMILATSIICVVVRTNVFGHNNVHPLFDSTVQCINKPSFSKSTCLNRCCFVQEETLTSRNTSDVFLEINESFRPTSQKRIACVSTECALLSVYQNVHTLSEHSN